MGARVAKTFKTVASYTLSQLEERFGPRLPGPLFPKAAEKANSRRTMAKMSKRNLK